MSPPLEFACVGGVDMRRLQIAHHRQKLPVEPPRQSCLVIHIKNKCHMGAYKV